MSTRTRAAAWFIPLMLGGVAAAVVVAAIVARRGRSSPAISAVAQEIARANPNVPPEIAAINAQLAQIAALRAGAIYGPGLEKTVRAPIASLRSALGEDWRELGEADGHVRLLPTGTRSAYFQVGAVVVAGKGQARLVLRTSEHKQATAFVGNRAFEVINFGPLPTPTRGPIDITLSSRTSTGEAGGPSLVMSPLQSEFRQAGEWVTPLPALFQPGPAGSRGLYLLPGSSTRFALTPGVRGKCVVVLEGASSRGDVKIAVSMGREAHSVLLRDSLTSANLGPYARSGGVLTESVEPRHAKPASSLFVSHIRLQPVLSQG